MLAWFPLKIHFVLVFVSITEVNPEVTYITIVAMPHVNN